MRCGGQGVVDTKGAEVEFRRAIDCNSPRSDDAIANAHSNLGKLMYNHKNGIYDAENNYRRALEINPTHATARIGLGLVLMDGMNDDAGAETEFREVLKVNANDAFARKCLQRIENRKLRSEWRP